jgi:colicin import membrane protein
MMNTGVLQPSLLPPERPGGLLGAGALALLAHALLIGALALGLNWRIRTPETAVAAELWSAIPQVAAPAAVAPPPPEPAAQPRPTPKPPPVERRAEPAPALRDAQIAIEKAERDKKAAQEREAEQRRRQKALDDERKQAQLLAEQKKAELDKAAKLKEERRQKELAAQRDAKADEERVARQREANLKRMLGQAGAEGAPTATGNAARDAAPSAAYAGRIKARINPNIVLTSDVQGNPVAEVEVRCAPDGTIISKRIVKPSGDRLWDDTVLRAIDRTEMLPRDVDGRVPSTITLVFPRRE